MADPNSASYKSIFGGGSLNAAGQPAQSIITAPYIKKEVLVEDTATEATTASFGLSSQSPPVTKTRAVKAPTKSRGQPANGRSTKAAESRGPLTSNQRGKANSGRQMAVQPQRQRRPAQLAPRCKRLTPGPNFSAPNQHFVNIIVGPDAQKFTIHQSSLVFHSSFFLAVFSDGTTESETGEMRLPDIDADVFGLLNNWLYNRKIERVDINGLHLNPISIMELAALWTYAGDWNILDLQNMAMQQLAEKVVGFDRELSTEEGSQIKEFIAYAYSTKGTTQLKHLAVHKMICILPDPECSDEFIESLPEAMILDFTKALAKHFFQVPFDLRSPSPPYRKLWVGTEEEFYFSEY